MGKSIRLNFSLVLSVLLCVSYNSLFAQSNEDSPVKVFTRNEKVNDNTGSTPRLYIENTGEETLSDFSIYYNFTTEDGQEPILEEYYVPQCD
ncbi:MAG: hypothetical protein ACOCSE_06595, partial [Chitinivibrionales bacterium]